MIFRNGSIITVCMMLALTIAAAPSIDVRLTTSDSEPLKEAAEGEPFIMTVTVHDARDIGVPEVTMPDECQWRQTGTSMYSRNGTQRVSYIYSVRLDHVGDYLLGPVSIVVDGTRLTSPQVPVFVEYPGVVANQKKKNKEKQELVFARLSLSKQEAYVQERIKAQLKFYRKQGSSIEFDQVVEPDHAHPGGYQVCNRTEPRVGREQVNGSWYDYLEWTWDIYPERAGDLIIPAYKIDYIARVDDGISLFGFSFGAQRLVRQSTYSNAVTITAQGLPKGIDPDVVGVVYDVSLKAHPTLLHEGEATTLTFSITTDADIERSRLSVKGIPEGFKSYPSKKQTRYDGKGNQVHDIEYVLQAKQQGEWEIPSQSCSYFDTRNGTHHTRWTAAVPLTVMPGAIASKNTANQSLVESAQQKTQVAPFWDSTVDGRAHTMSISWTIIAMLVGLMLLVLLVNCGYAWAPRVTIAIPFFNRWFTEYRAQAQIKGVSSADQLYPALLRAYAIIVSKPVEQVSLHEIDQRMSRQTSEQEYRAWQEFASRITQARYAQRQRSEDKLLCEESRRWITKISRLQ